MLAPTDLTKKQLLRLEGLSKSDPLARIIGWSHIRSGPIIRRTNGVEYILTINGRLTKITDFYIDPKGQIKRESA